MELTPREKDKLLIFTAALLAERRKEQRLEAELSGSSCVYQRCDHGRRSRRRSLFRS